DAPIERLETRYQARYRDGHKPVLLFLAESPARARSIREVIAEWRQKGAGRGLEVSAATAESAAAELLELLGEYAPPVASAPAEELRVVSDEEVALLARFAASAKQRFELLRDCAARLKLQVHET